MTGANFSAEAAVSVSGTGIVLGNVKVASATQIAATLSIAAGAPAGIRDVS